MPEGSQPPLKRCTTCGEGKPATAEYFYRDKSFKCGLSSKCKQCKKQYQHANKEHIARYQHQWHKANRERINERHRKRYHADPDYRYQYYLTNREYILEYQRRYRRDNRERILEYDRKRAKLTREYHARNSRRWRLANPEALRRHHHLRRSRKRALYDKWTARDWGNALKYFNGCCAVCGRQLKDLFGTHTAAADHWIPLASPDCPGTIPTNIIPLCHGENGCNNRKSARNAREFLETEFGKRKASQILKRIGAYFEWVKNQPD